MKYKKTRRIALGSALWALLAGTSPNQIMALEGEHTRQPEAPTGSVYQQSDKQNTYLNNGFYIRFKEEEGIRCVPYNPGYHVRQIPVLKSMQEVYGIHPIMQSMKIGNNPILERTFFLEFDSTSRMEQLLQELQRCKEIEKVEKVPLYFIQSLHPDIEQSGNSFLQENPASKVLPDPDLLAQEESFKEDITLDKQTTDPFYGTIDGNNLSWHLDLIHAEEAWNIQTASADVVVAVVDNAVWGEHPDLLIPAERQYNIQSGQTGNSAPPSSVEPDPGCDNLMNCYAYNWSHGTHCAGAIGAIRNNGEGIASIGSGVSLMGVSCPGSASSNGLEVRNGFAGITWAAQHGAKVINVSWGGYNVSETEREIIQACIDEGIVIVAAAGNDGYKDAPLYPANLPGVISVGSCNSNRTLSSFSNYGDWVTLAAPGGFVVTNGQESSNCILSTTYCTSQNYRLKGIRALDGKPYDGMYGTSMATPVVSGLCGLLLTAQPDLGPYEIREILMSSAQKVDESNGKYIRKGSGIIDAASAIRRLQNHIPGPDNLSLTRNGWTIDLKWEKPSDETTGKEGEVVSYQIFRNYELIAETKDESYSDTLSSSGLYQYGVRTIYTSDTSIRSCQDIYVPVLYSVNVTIRPENCGSVSGADVYPKDEIATLVARAVKGCKFSRWMEDNKVLGRDSVLEYEVAYDTELTAVFTGNPDPASIENYMENGEKISVYPNPASHDQIFVKTNGLSHLLKIDIYSINGVSIKTIHLSENSSLAEIDIHTLPSGTYILKVMTNKGIEVVRFNKL